MKAKWSVRAWYTDRERNTEREWESERGLVTGFSFEVLSERKSNHWTGGCTHWQSSAAHVVVVKSVYLSIKSTETIHFSSLLFCSVETPLGTTQTLSFLQTNKPPAALIKMRTECLWVTQNTTFQLSHKPAQLYKQSTESIRLLIHYPHQMKPLGRKTCQSGGLTNWLSKNWNGVELEWQLFKAAKHSMKPMQTSLVLFVTNYSTWMSIKCHLIITVVIDDYEMMMMIKRILKVDQRHECTVYGSSELARVKASLKLLEQSNCSLKTNASSDAVQCNKTPEAKLS